MSFNTKFYFGGKTIPVTMYEDKERIALSFPYNKQLVEEIKTSTESRQWDGKSKSWILKKTPRNYFVLDFLQGFKPYSRYDMPLKDYNIKGFWRHQNKMYSHILTRKQIIIAGEMRTGKTRPTLKAIEDTKSNGAWWIAPKSALRGLKNELIKWQFPYEIKLITYDTFRRLYSGSHEHIPKFIVFDECQKIKNARSKQGQNAKEIANLQRDKYGIDNCYLVLLSGTPSPKDPSDWWNLAETACPGFLREASQTVLKNRLGEFEQREGQVGQMYWHLLQWKEDEVTLLYERLSGLVEVFLKKDCLDLPQKEYTVVEIEPSDMYIKAANMIKDVTMQKMTIFNKLRQLSDGFQYVGNIDLMSAEKVRETEYFPDCPKDKQLRNDLKEFEDVGRVVVYCGFQASLDKIVTICIDEDWAVLKVDGRGWHALNTTLTVEECLALMDGSHEHDHDIKLAFCAQADAASTGLELSASPVIIYYSNSYNGAARMQSEDRAYSNNMDKVRGLEIRDYIHLPTDLLARNNLLEKKTLQAITMGDIENAMEGIWKRTR